MTRLPIRTCSGTGTRHPQGVLLRFVNIGGVPTPEILLHPTHRASGRGVYILPSPEAYASAIKRKAFTNRLKTSKPPLSWEEILPHLPASLRNPV